MRAGRGNGGSGIGNEGGLRVPKIAVVNCASARLGSRVPVFAVEFCASARVGARVSAIERVGDGGARPGWGEKVWICWCFARFLGSS